MRRPQGGTHKGESPTRPFREGHAIIFIKNTCGYQYFTPKVPIYYFIFTIYPMYILTTERLRLREMTPADAEFAYLLNLDEEVVRYTGDAAFESVAAAKSHLEKYASYRTFGYGRWGCELKTTGELVGWCGLKNDEGLIDLGYRFFKKDWGYGYASEAAAACLAFGHDTLGMSEIIAKAANDNPASLRVMQKIGMVKYRELISDCLGLPSTWYISKK
jgi:[ribosomal protein S5]-alanine N-acetyltransferase